jgi:phage tail-like protein
VTDHTPPPRTEATLTGGTSHRQAEASTGPGQLLVYSEGQLVRVLALNVPVVTIGRTPANVLPLPNPAVSRAHADLRISPEGVILTDRGSANGTWVEDVRLAPEQPVQLVHGNVIRIGPFQLRYEAVASAPPSTGTDGAPLVEERPSAPPPVIAQMPVPAPAFEPSPPPRPLYPVPAPTDTVSSYLDFLPVIFQDGDFLGRFLLIFQSIWEPLEHRQDHMDMYFDPRTCPASFLPWLADWFGVSVGQVSEEGRLRNLIGEAVELYRWRGTRYGLTRLIEVCTGITPLIAESPNNPAILHIRVTIPPESNVERDTIDRLVKLHKPAHTAYLLEVFS